ncbi:MAG TPA: hypothetical protein VLB02_03135 [Candidatus Paceibacterota bacterium]|nr:hypothetical protein [Candidatus Paceibacterota bacterium]
MAIFCCSILLHANPIEGAEKAIESFKKTFSTAENVSWYKTGEHENCYYHVSFLLGVFQIKATYNQQGDMVSGIRYYSPLYLPPNIATTLKKEYGGKTLFGVTETTNAEGAVTYFVKMYDDKKWYTVKIFPSGEFIEYEKYKRADIGIN